MRLVIDVPDASGVGIIAKKFGISNGSDVSIAKTDNMSAVVTLLHSVLFA